MARFRYSLQSILNIKEKLETQKRQEFAAAQIALSEQQEKTILLKKRLSDCESRARDLLSGPLDFLEIQENKALQLSLENRLKIQLVEEKKAEENLERIKEEMVSARTERKTYETLREQAFREFIQEENKEESRVVDELVSYTFGQKKKG